MGYELHIQREDKSKKIKLSEWKDYVLNDFEFESIEEFSANFGNGRVLTISTPNAGLWKSPKGDVPFTFSEKYGWITVKNPDDWVIAKMILIADALNAVVLGEEEEKYDMEYLKKEFGYTKKGNKKTKWWKFWR